MSAASTKVHWTTIDRLTHQLTWYFEDYHRPQENRRPNVLEETLLELKGLARENAGAFTSVDFDRLLVVAGGYPTAARQALLILQTVLRESDKHPLGEADVAPQLNPQQYYTLMKAAGVIANGKIIRWQYTKKFEDMPHQFASVMGLVPLHIKREAYLLADQESVASAYLEARKTLNRNHVTRGALLPVKRLVAGMIATAKNIFG